MSNHANRAFCDYCPVAVETTDGSGWGQGEPYGWTLYPAPETDQAREYYHFCTDVCFNAWLRAHGQAEYAAERERGEWVAWA